MLIQHRRMRIVSWNVNSLNVRLPHVLQYLEQAQPDLLALQETKLPDDKFPRSEIEQNGYRVIYSGQKTYNGVAILSRTPASDVVCDLPGLDDPQRRLLAATVDGVRVINVYIPNGQEVGSEKYDYKFRWLEALHRFLTTEMERHRQLVLLGDFNIAPADIDVHNPARWRDKIMCSAKERDFFTSLLALGLNDTLRQLHPEEGMHTWWDYRLNAFGRNWGLRIDHILASAALSAEAGGVARDYRALERPSDHAPVWAELA